ncbi:hypothetical protein, partial [Shewanella sairae]|uniref:hypothetical protein n=1 Tax=Shewanella sairae TaxID=190310 RepID=UPI001C807F2C
MNLNEDFGIRTSPCPVLLDHYTMRDLVIESLIDEKPDDVVPQISTYKDLSRLCGIVAVHIKGSG